MDLAVVQDLMARIDALIRENQALQQRLARFVGAQVQMERRMIGLLQQLERHAYVGSIALLCSANMSAGERPEILELAAMLRRGGEGPRV